MSSDPGRLPTNDVVLETLFDPSNSSRPRRRGRSCRKWERGDPWPDHEGLI